MLSPTVLEQAHTGLKQVLSNMAKMVIKDVIDALVEVSKKLSEIISSLKHIALSITDVVSTSVKSIETLKVTQRHLKYQAKKASEELWRVVSLASNYCESVVVFLRCGQNEGVETRVMEDVRRGNYKSLQSLIQQLRRNLGHALKNYEEFEEMCKTAREVFIQRIKECEEKKTEATIKKTVTQVAGVVGAGVGTGVALSVVAGVFTLGIGTIVGLGITAVGTAIGGAAVGATATVAHATASDFAKSAVILMDFCNSLESMDNTAAEMSKCLFEMDISLMNLSKCVDDVEDNMKTCNDFLNNSVEQLLEVIRNSYQLSLSCREKVTEEKEKFEAEMNKMFKVSESEVRKHCDLVK